MQAGREPKEIFKEKDTGATEGQPQIKIQTDHQREGRRTSKERQEA